MLILCYTGKEYMKKRKPAKINFRPTLFWDVDPKRIDPDKRARYVAERIMDFGNDQEVRWMLRYYPLRLLREVANKSRALQPQSRALWKLLTTNQ